MKIWTTSFRDSNSSLWMFWSKWNKRSVLYVSCASWAINSGTGSASWPRVNGVVWTHGRECAPPSPYKIALICCRFFATSSLAWIHVQKACHVLKAAAHLPPNLSTRRSCLQPGERVSKASDQIGGCTGLRLEEVHDCVIGSCLDRKLEVTVQARWWGGRWQAGI